MKKVLHIVGHLGNGGDTASIMNIMNYINLNDLEYSFDFVTHKGCDLTFVKKIQEGGNNVFILDGDARQMGSFKYFLSINNILKNNKYDSVHFHTSFQSIVGIAACKFNKIKNIVCHSHTTKIQRKVNIIKEKTYIPICRFLINILSDKKIACSEYAGAFLFGKNKKFNVVYNGIDTKKSEIDFELIDSLKKELNIKKNTVVIGQVGRFDDNKNQKFSLNIIESLPKNYLLVFLGDGETIDTIKQECKNRKIKNVKFMGKVSNVEVYMKIFDFLLLPSKYGEGLPTVIVEAQIYNNKCKCLASDIVTRECNLGNTIFLSLNNIESWIEILRKEEKENKSNIDCYKFDIKNTATEWLDLYN